RVADMDDAVEGRGAVVADGDLEGAARSRPAFEVAGCLDMDAGAALGAGLAERMDDIVPRSRAEGAAGAIAEPLVRRGRHRHIEMDARPGRHHLVGDAA